MTVQLCAEAVYSSRLALLPEMEWNEKAPDSLSALNYELVWPWQTKRYLNQNLIFYNQTGNTVRVNNNSNNRQYCKAHVCHF